ncbi:MAG: DUF4290 domain-containing protein [Muribaculaceae bacterium]|nr:DUF4290 domain-containing protein [Muribaculaceae bacterium]MDE6135437.1 DUF4290 domain-containing protein [Muribaculaceae bacterium]
MIKYTNQMRPLILPEYGRNIQNMVDHCVTIEDDEQRQTCAETIVRSMKVLFPCTGDPVEHERKLWDHMLIMSGYSLNVFLPYGPPEAMEHESTPEPIAYNRPASGAYHHYGMLIQQLAEKVGAMEMGQERDELISMLANQMKKSMLAYNRDGIEDSHVFADLAAMTHGAIRLDLEPIMLHDYRQAVQPNSKRKKKKK